MDVFALRKRLVDDYRAYTGSFINISDPRVRELVDRALDDGAFWPEPLVQLNPAFDSGGPLEDLVRAGSLHPGCADIFRARKTRADPRGSPLTLHAHQRQAIELALRGESYILTSGTGSGKSLAYIVPIVDHVLKTGSGRGIQAIVVYPMNALANSQREALREFLETGTGAKTPPATFAAYTGQEQGEVRENLRRNPPDILLTNYMMLELMLTRVEDRTLVRAAEGLRFLVLDELHTYRGRQGADVAMLIRRCREAFKASRMVCAGTSATLAGEGTGEEQRAEVARVATTLFGEPIEPSRVIGETLRRATPEFDAARPGALPAIREAVADPRPPGDPEAFRTHPFSSWIESELGVAPEAGGDRLVRRTPRPLRGAGTRDRPSASFQLAQLTGAAPEACAAAIEAFLRKGAALPLAGSNRFKIFAFRLHQFFTRGDTVWASLESESVRHLEIGKKLAAPGDRDKPLFPLVFCRECGTAYYQVFRQSDRRGTRYTPRDPSANFEPPDTEPGFLYVSDETPWPAGRGAETAARLPDFMTDGSTIGKEHAKHLPVAETVLPTGECASGAGGIPAAFSGENFPFCLAPSCRIAYMHTQRSPRQKLGTLGIDNRSTATTILAVRTLLELLSDRDLLPEARKLLSFTDNRQDASLQAGHFNDFVHVALLRSGLCKALAERGSPGLRHDDLAAAVLDAMNLPPGDFSAQPGLEGAPRIETLRILNEAVSYFLYRDLRRDWRVTAPNIEECGLLRFDYLGLDDLLDNGALWDKGIQDGGRGAPAAPAPAFLCDCDRREREGICRTLLDHLRRDLAIKADVLDPERQHAFVQRSLARLREDSPWCVADAREMESFKAAYPRPDRAQGRGRTPALYLSSRGTFGAFLRRRMRSRRGAAARAASGEVDDIISFLFRALHDAGILARVQMRGRPDDPAYQINPAALIWLPGDGARRFHDSLRVTRNEGAESIPNRYFVEVYRKFIDIKCTLEAREHTAQVDGEDRQDREERFKSGALPLLFCSPTMELGVDIADLNIVNMRNVPPTPANYAQRSGRAGRQGQPALVFTYCAGQSPHDQYFFREPERMVAGAVAPPRLDLRNRDLIASHVHAIWLQTDPVELGKSLSRVIDLPGAGEPPELPLNGEIRAALADPAHRARAALAAGRILAGLASELDGAPWYTPGWEARVLDQIHLSFDRACDRWRSLYRAAAQQQSFHNRVIQDHSRPQRERNDSKRMRDHAEVQLALLTDPGRVREGDFYSYRYLATEGFLPGYNFPRLPISAYVPGRRGMRGRDEFVSRPRFLAISEFGPRAIVYHEGARYSVYKVNLDLGAGDPGGADPLATSTMKRCTACAYAHMGADAANLAEVCDGCGSPLERDSAIANLVQMKNVSLKLRQRISCDEEERMRMGYELLAAYSFPGTGARSARRDAVAEGGGVRARLSYGDAAEIYRINRGWARSSASGEHGFLLNRDSGTWASRPGEEADADDPDDAPQGGRQVRIVPFVRDTKNALVIRFDPAPGPDTLAGLESALKLAIQQRFQLEPRELAAEPVPSREDRREILLYEAAEGGAGVLRRLAEDPDVLPDLARRALKIIHIDPDTFEDPAAAACSRACYECLLDYGNQRDHAILDRTLLVEPLRALAAARCTPSGGAGPREERLADLRARCDSDLERRLLDLLDRLGLRLPDDAQAAAPGIPVRPDFLYRDRMAAVFVDGPRHDTPGGVRKDESDDRALGEAGYSVVRFHFKADWAAILRAHPDIFGTPRP